MTASREPDAEPHQGAAAVDGAPESPEESARARELAALFGPSDDPAQQQADARADTTRDQLAALFAQSDHPQPETPSPDPEPLPDSFWESGPAGEEQAATVAPEPSATASVPVDPEPPAAVSETEPSTITRSAEVGDLGASQHEPAAASAKAGDDDATDPDPEPRSATEALAWLGFDPEPEPEVVAEPEPEPEPGPEPVPAPTTAAAGWLGVVRGTTDSTAPLPPATATPTVVEPTATLVVTDADTSAGAFFPAERRGIRAWSPRVRWSVAISIVLLIGVVAGSVLIARSISANNLAAQELTAAVAELEAAESLAEEPEAVLATTVASYDDTVELARATADSAAPPLVAVAGMTAQPLLDASSAALAALVAQLDAASFEDPPEAYEREEIDLAEIAQVESATQTATDHAERVTTAIREVSAAQTALQEKLNALRIAQVTLGASLPETAVLIVGENRRALQSFRDAVIAAAAAVGAAQSVGGSGDAELLAYAAAVNALRGDQARVVNGTQPTQPTQPANPAPQPTPTTAPAPPPAPAPEPSPEPEPEPVPDPPTPVPTP